MSWRHPAARRVPCPSLLPLLPDTPEAGAFLTYGTRPIAAGPSSSETYSRMTPAMRWPHLGVQHEGLGRVKFRRWEPQAPALLRSLTGATRLVHGTYASPNIPPYMHPQMRSTLAPDPSAQRGWSGRGRRAVSWILTSDGPHRWYRPWGLNCTEAVIWLLGLGATGHPARPVVLPRKQR